MDGYDNYVQSTALQDICYYHKILMVKEEADTSHFCPSYDNQVALADKYFTCQMVDFACHILKGMLNIYHLIASSFVALKRWELLMSGGIHLLM